MIGVKWWGWEAPIEAGRRRAVSVKKSLGSISGDAMHNKKLQLCNRKLCLHNRKLIIFLPQTVLLSRLWAQVSIWIDFSDQS